MRLIVGREVTTIVGKGWTGRCTAGDDGRWTWVFGKDDLTEKHFAGRKWTHRTDCENALFEFQRYVVDRSGEAIRVTGRLASQQQSFL